MGKAALIPRLVLLLGRLLAFRPVDLASVPASPWVAIILWLVAALIGLAEYLLQPAISPGGYGSILAGVCVPLFAALAVAGLWRRDALVPVASTFLLLVIANAAADLWIGLLVPGQSAGKLVTILPLVWAILAGAQFLSRNAQDLSELRRFFILLAVLVAILGRMGVAWLDTAVVELGYRYVWQAESSDGAATAFDDERFWTAQPALVAQATDQLTSGDGPPRTYVLSIAPDGTQAVFEREALRAGAVLRERYGTDSQLAVFSNASGAIGRRPAATRTNLAALARGLKRHANPGRDLIVVYLTSHGSRSGALSTTLPNYADLAPVSARLVRRFLDEVGVERRIVIVSACFSGSWIAPLRTPNSIVLTAASADRTSFGCSDDRDYTVFGKAVIDNMADGRISLAKAFDEVKHDVSREERVEEVEPSLPQAFVGANMEGLWNRAGADGRQ